MERLCVPPYLPYTHDSDGLGLRANPTRKMIKTIEGFTHSHPKCFGVRVGGSADNQFARTKAGEFTGRKDVF